MADTLKTDTSAFANSQIAPDLRYPVAHLLQHHVPRTLAYLHNLSFHAKKRDLAVPKLMVLAAGK